MLQAASFNTAWCPSNLNAELRLSGEKQYRGQFVQATQILQCISTGTLLVLKNIAKFKCMHLFCTKFMHVPCVDRLLCAEVMVEANFHYIHSESQGRQEYQLGHMTYLKINT